MNTNKNVNKHAEALFQRFPELLPESENFYKVYHIIENAFVNSKTLFLCGNGGSAADCEHIVGELMKNFVAKRPHSADMRSRFKTALDGDDSLLNFLEPGLRAISLLGHPALSSAFANDVDAVYNYAQQLYVLGREGDVVIGISTSGNARNVLNCFKTARAMGIGTILFTGLNHGACEKYADTILRAPSFETYRIQEYHLPMYHMLCIMLEERFYGKES